MNLKIPTLLTLTFLLCSCATLLNRPEQEIYIFSDDKDTRFIIRNDTLDSERKSIKLKRSSKPVNVLVYNDTICDSVQLKSKLDNVFIVGNLGNYGIGYIIDLTNPKKFEYPKYNLINITDKGLYVEQPHSSIRLTLGLHSPGLQMFENRFTSFYNLNPVAISVGAEGDISKKWFASANFYILPPDSKTYKGNSQSTSSYNFNLLIHKKIGKLELGGGINFTNISYDFYHNNWYDNDFLTIGPSLRADYYLYSDFNLSAELHSSIIDRLTNKHVYGYMFSVGISYKLQFWKLETAKYFKYLK